MLGMYKALQSYDLEAATERIPPAESLRYQEKRQAHRKTVTQNDPPFPPHPLRPPLPMSLSPVCWEALGSSGLRNQAPRLMLPVASHF